MTNQQHPITPPAELVAEEPSNDELLELFYENDWNYISPETFEDITCAVLARWGHPHPTPQPVAEGPTDEEWDALVTRAWDQHQTVGYQGERFMYDSDFGNALDFVRRELARWGRPTPQPVPVSERLPLRQRIAMSRGGGGYSCLTTPPTRHGN